MNSTKKLKLLSTICFLSTALTIAVATATNSNIINVAAAPQTCEVCNGSHYDLLNNTSTTAGTKEYWVCCTCHTHYLSKPSTGTWSDAGTASSVESTDDRYIPAYGDKSAMTEYLKELGFSETTARGASAIVQNSDGTYTLKNYTDKTATSLIIPEGVSSLGVVGTKSSTVFSGMTNLHWIVIPESCTEIGPNCFKNCASDLTLYFVGNTTKTTANFNGNPVKAIYKVQGTGWDYVDGVPTAK